MGLFSFSSRHILTKKNLEYPPPGVFKYLMSHSLAIAAVFVNSRGFSLTMQSHNVIRYNYENINRLRHDYHPFTIITAHTGCPTLSSFVTLIHYFFIMNSRLRTKRAHRVRMLKNLYDISLVFYVLVLFVLLSFFVLYMLECRIKTNLN